MKTQPLALAAALTLLAILPGYSQTQSPSDLLQKGIHLQEAAGDVDGAVQFFRQVVASAYGTNRALAAQAQYQLVLCMLQKGDRAAAAKELSTLEHGYADMPELVSKARKLLPGSSTLLPAPWGDNECEQLNIKRDGVATGEYLFYSADAWTTTASENDRQGRLQNPFYKAWLEATHLKWTLKTRASTRSISLVVDDQVKPLEYGTPNNLQHATTEVESDDELGDASALPFVGPATDWEESIFLLRRLPLAVGYKTSIPVKSNTVAAVNLELNVTAIESLTTPAGKFNCYRVLFPALQETFWIGAEGAHPFVKFQHGTVEAELVKVWGTANLLQPISVAASAASLNPQPVLIKAGGLATMRMEKFLIDAKVHKLSTPKQDLAKLLEGSVTNRVAAELNATVRPGSLRNTTIGGQPAVVCLIDYTNSGNPVTLIAAWIASENALYEITTVCGRGDVGLVRMYIDPFLAAIQNLQ